MSGCSLEAGPLVGDSAPHPPHIQLGEGKPQQQSAFQYPGPLVMFLSAAPALMKAALGSWIFL